ncbi:hypothetical protein N7492_005050 [Penicillium capsulatum]|uniref:F-box domain-containing protein n=1 Tax=Penicillium capsulatum TaxID=69766 RepID=A0A9W9IF34_9EURO|nr:hypothetical protein N7492_005050 [Penicillium capsulatum]KAJ6135842.1 hypothetical protein N7512_001002 [Penicillium capsulatum]
MQRPEFSGSHRGNFPFKMLTSNTQTLHAHQAACRDSHEQQVDVNTALVSRTERLHITTLRLRAGFLHLPFELRLMIYKYCLPQGHTINVTKPWILYQAKQMLLVSRQVTADVLQILFSENTFEVPLNADGERGLIRNFSLYSRSFMQDLLITAVPTGNTYCNSEPDVSLWQSMIPHLKRLQIVVSQPIPPLSSMRLAVTHWARWIGRYLIVFARFLQESTVVLLDANDRKPTIDIAKEILPAHLQIARLARGDLIFLRGVYAAHGARFARMLQHLRMHPGR